MIWSLAETLSAARLACVRLLGLDGPMWGRDRRPPPRRPGGRGAATA